LSDDPAVFEVREALAESGCAVCRLVSRSVGRWMQAVAYEQVNNIELRDRLRAARGFCNAHAQRWLAEVRNVLGTAIIYRDVLRAEARDLESGGGRRALGGSLLGRGRRASVRCPACQEQDDAEQRYVGALLVVASSGGLGEAEGPCRKHLRVALRAGGAGADALLARARQTIDELVKDLDEVIRKEDYRFRHEPRSETDRTAPARGIAWAAGGEGVVDTS
jgi:hypothetical protein